MKNTPRDAPWAKAVHFVCQVALGRIEVALQGVISIDPEAAFAFASQYMPTLQGAQVHGSKEGIDSAQPDATLNSGSTVHGDETEQVRDSQADIAQNGSTTGALAAWRNFLEHLKPDDPMAADYMARIAMYHAALDWLATRMPVDEWLELIPDEAGLEEYLPAIEKAFRHAHAPSVQADLEAQCAAFARAGA